MSNNIQTEWKGSKLTITVDLSEKIVRSAPQSKSGKNRLFASSEGTVTVNSGPSYLPVVKIGLNVFG